MMTDEEIALRLKMNSTQLDQDAGKAKRSLEGFAKEGEKSFVHVGNAGRDFHKLMERITEQSPIMGTALKAVLSPVGGALTAAALAFGAVNGALEQFNRRLDEARDRNARSVLGADFTKALRDRVEQLKQSSQDFEESERRKSAEAANAEVLAKDQAEKKNADTLEQQRRDDGHQKRLRQIQDEALLQNRLNDDNYKAEQQRLERLATLRGINPLARQAIAASMEAQHAERSRQIQDEQTADTRRETDAKTAADRAAARAANMRQRQSLAKQHADLTRQAAAAQAELDRATKNAGNTKLEGAAEMGQRHVKALEDELAELDKTRAADQEAQADFEAGGAGKGNLLADIRYAMQTGDFSGAKANAAIRNLDRRSQIKRELDKARPAAEMAQRARSDADKELARAQAGVSSILDQIRANEKASAALPPPEAPAASHPALTIDPATGGIMYHGLQSHGGVAYRNPYVRAPQAPANAAQQLKQAIDKTLFNVRIADVSDNIK